MEFMTVMLRDPCAEAQIRSGRAASPCSKESRPWILAATILGSSMAFIDGTVVNIALPALQSQMNATILDVQWVVEAYVMRFAQSVRGLAVGAEGHVDQVVGDAFFGKREAGAPHIGAACRAIDSRPRHVSIPLPVMNGQEIALSPRSPQ